MENKTNTIKTTNGYFDVVVDVEICPDTFELSKPGKNNPSWIQNVMNTKVTTPDGKSMYMSFRSGFDSSKPEGKKIFTSKEDGTQLEIPFSDRNNDVWKTMVDQKRMVKVALGKSEKIDKKEDGTEVKYKSWDYINFLDVFDAITLLQQRLGSEIGKTFKFHIKGSQKLGEYNGDVTKNFDLQSIFLLTGNEEQGKELDYKLGLTQNVILTNGCVDDSKIDDEKDAIVTINSKVMIKDKKEYKTLPVPLTMKVNDANRDTVKKLLDLYFKGDDGKVRRINLDCEYEVGYVSGEVSYDDLPEEAKQLIELGVYSMEEISKMYANKQRVDNIIIKRPVVKKDDKGKIMIDFSDNDYKVEDLEGREANIAVEEEVDLTETVNDIQNLLNDLDLTE